MIAGIVVAVAVLAKFNFSPAQMLDTAAANHEDGRAILGPGTYLSSPWLVIFTGLTIFIGTAGLPHILMRFFTVPEAARTSVLYTISLIAFFTVLVTVIGFGARAVLGADAAEEVGKGGNLAAPLLAASLGGERGYDELLLRSELGVGAEAGPTGRFKREPEPAVEPVR